MTIYKYFLFIASGAGLAACSTQPAPFRGVASETPLREFPSVKATGKVEDEIVEGCVLRITQDPDGEHKPALNFILSLTFKDDAGTGGMMISIPRAAWPLKEGWTYTRTAKHSDDDDDEVLPLREKISYARGTLTSQQTGMGDGKNEWVTIRIKGDPEARRVESAEFEGGTKGFLGLPKVRARANCQF